MRRRGLTPCALALLTVFAACSDTPLAPVMPFEVSPPQFTVIDGGESDKSAKSAKSTKSDKSSKSDKSTKSCKSGRSHKSAKTHKSGKSHKSGKGKKG